MNKLPEEIVELKDLVNKKIAFFSKITGLPASRTIDDCFEDGTIFSSNKFAFNFNLGENYEIKYGYTGNRFEWFKLNWNVSFKGNTLLSESSNFCTSNNIPENLISKKDKTVYINLMDINSFFGYLDPIDTPFMDYEEYTINSMKNNESHNYFQSLYLMLMCNWKETNPNTLPPILSKNVDIREPMEKGDIAELDKQLNMYLQHVSEIYGEKAYHHSKEEANLILEFGMHNNNYHNPEIPLEKKFPSAMKFKVPGTADGKKYNIMIVEPESIFKSDEFHSNLSKKLLLNLTKLGGYAETTIYSIENFHESMLISGTGQLDAIIIKSRQNTLYDVNQILSQSSSNIKLSIDGGEIPAVDSYGEAGNIQSLIFNEIKKNGHNIPPSIIVDKNYEGKDIGKLVDVVLLKNNFGSIKNESINNRYSDELRLAGKMQYTVDELVKHINPGNSMSMPYVALINDTNDYINTKITEYKIETLNASTFSLVNLGKNNLTVEEFNSAVHELARQYFSPFHSLEEMSTNNIVEGLNKIDSALMQYPGHPKDEALDLITDTIAYFMNVQSTILKDQRNFYSNDNGGPSLFFTAFNNYFIIAKHLNEVSLYKDSLNLEHYRLNNFTVSEYENYTDLNTFIQKSFFPTTLNITKDLVGDDNPLQNPISKYVLSHSRKLAKITGNLKEFDKLYREIFRNGNH